MQPGVTTGLVALISPLQQSQIDQSVTEDARASGVGSQIIRESLGVLGAIRQGSEQPPAIGCQEYLTGLIAGRDVIEEVFWGWAHEPVAMGAVRKRTSGCKILSSVAIELRIDDRRHLPGIELAAQECVDLVGL